MTTIRKNVNYIILPELNLILECYKGQPKVIDIIKMKKEELLNESFNHNYNVIADFREFDMIFKSKYLKLLSSFVEFLNETKSNITIALLTKMPHQVVISQFLKFLSDDLPVKFEIFSTLECAIKKVDCSIANYDLINDTLTELNKNTI